MHIKRLTIALLASLLVAPLAIADGNVTVELRGRDLVVTGDALGNGVRLEDGGVGGDVQIVGFLSTTVNGGSAPVFFDLPQRTIRFDMQGGDDAALVFASIDLGDVDVDLGEGADGFLGGVNDTVFGNLTVRNPGGSSSIELYSATVSDTLRIEGGPGADTVTLTSGALTIDKALKVELGGGADSLSMCDVVCNGKVVVLPGEGDDTLILEQCVIAKTMKIVTGGGNSLITLDHNTFQKPVKIVGGNDGVAVMGTSSEFRKGLNVRTGEGPDSVGLFTTTFGGPLKVSTRGGEDVIVLRNGSTLARGAAVKGGDAQDKIDIFDSTAGRKVKFLGQDGDDLMRAAFNTFAKGLLFVGGRGTDLTNAPDVGSLNTFTGGKYVEKSIEGFD